ncbi:MAG: cytochrome c peroxidase [Bacteroidota bacterium]
MKGTLLIISCVSILILLTSGIIDLGALLSYANQVRPAYIVKDNTAGNTITNARATLGRVLFYDKKLSVNNTIACGSCHKQQFAFGDTALRSLGVAGITNRHGMRLVNARFGTEARFFWDERAATLENQTTRPIQDHIEMGFSGANGDPGLDSLIRKLSGISYYNTLFAFAFGTSTITEARMQDALAQFVRSMQSFDSRFDTGFAAAPNLGAPFPNFTPGENAGKALFLNPPGPGGGAGCQGCHRAPEFDIDPASRNNNILGNLVTPAVPDLTITRAPSLRDIVGPGGASNGAFMHDGSLATLADVVNHYNSINFNTAVNNNLDARLAGPPGSGGQKLNFTQAQKDNLIAFLRTLTGKSIYTDPRFSDPFDASGNITVSTSQGEPFVRIDGKTRLMVMDTLSTGDYVVVRQADGTLAMRKNRLTVSLTGDTLYNGANWVIIPGISAANH